MLIKIYTIYNTVRDKYLKLKLIIPNIFSIFPTTYVCSVKRREGTHILENWLRGTGLKHCLYIWGWDFWWLEAGILCLTVGGNVL